MALINWQDVNQQYPETVKLTDATRADSWIIPNAIAELESRLAPGFTVPFSTNNITAKDLATAITFERLWRFKDEKKAKLVRDYVDSRIKDLLSGMADMMLSDGTALVTVGGTIYSTTDGYVPVFGMSPTEYSVVDSQQVYDEEADRGFV